MWEYKFIEFTTPKTIFKGKADTFAIWEEHLNELGKQGWELVAVFALSIGAVAIFKRPIK